MPYYLRLDGELLATVTTSDLDGFWWLGTAETTEAYKKIEHLMLKASLIENDMELLDKIWDELL